MNARVRQWLSCCHLVVMVGLLSVTSVCCSHFTDRYAVQLDGGVYEAQRVAAQHGFVFVNEVHSSSASSLL